MKLIIAGSRSTVGLFVPNAELISTMIRTAGISPSLIVCGCAPGPDLDGFVWARSHQIPVEFFPAWEGQRKWALKNALPGEVVRNTPVVTHRGAGFVRNSDMARYADALLAIWDGESRGTENMIGETMRAGKPYGFVNLAECGEFCGPLLRKEGRKAG